MVNKSSARQAPFKGSKMIRLNNKELHETKGKIDLRQAGKIEGLHGKLGREIRLRRFLSI
jgi:hypothetical protein